MTITPWSDAAKALVGAAFGNPEMRAKQEEMDLKKQQFDLEQKKYGLDEAYNPARIGQAEASAGLDRAKAATEAISRAKSQIELDNILKFLEGPQTEPTMAPMPEFNPFNVGPQGQGRNPAMVLPYDQIQPLDSVDQPLDVSQLPPMPSTPPNPMTMGKNIPAPKAPDPFGDLIANLTGAPTNTTPPNGAQFFEQPPAPAMRPPVAPTDILTPEIRQMIAAGYLKPENISDMVLAAEAQGANRGVTDPQKRITNAAAGTGTFLSPDQVLAQALGATRDTATLGDLAETNLGTADIQNFEYGQNNKGFTEFLDTQNATPSFTVTNPDGTVVNYGRPGAGGKPLTEQQSKVAINASVMAPGIAVLTNAYNGGKSSSGANLAVKAMFGDDPFVTDMAQRAGFINKEDQTINAAINGVMNFLYLQTGAARNKEEDQRGYAELTPLASDTPENRSLKKAQLEQKARAIIRQGNPEIQEELLKAVEGIWTSQIPGSNNSIGPANPTTPTRITSDAEYEALAPGTQYIDPEGNQRTKR